MKYILILHLLSFATMPPTIEQSHISPIDYKIYFECISDGYIKSYNKILETGQKEVDKNLYAIEFMCQAKGDVI